MDDVFFVIVPEQFRALGMFLGTQALPKNSGAYVDTQNWHDLKQSKQSKGQNNQFDTNFYYFTSLACMTIVQEMEIVLRYFGHNFINEAKKYSKQH